MTYELQVVVWVVLVMFATLVVQVLMTIANQGFPWAVGPHDEPPVVSPVQGRVNRAVSNTIEGLVMFAPLALIAAVSGVSNGTTELGATLFLLSRIAFPVAYASGIPFVRTLAWAPGAVGTLLIAFVLISAPASG